MNLRPLLVFLLALAANQARGVTVSLPDTLPQIFGDGVSQATDPGLAGETIASMVSRFSYEGSRTARGCGDPGCAQQGTVDGEVQSVVVRTAAGRDDIYWRLTVYGDAFLPVQRMEVAGLPASHSLRIDWRNDEGAGAAPGYAAATAGILSIDWINPLGRPAPTPGEQTPWILLDAGAVGYTQQAALTLVTDSDGPGEPTMSGQSGPLLTYLPVIAPVPEPGRWALLAMGLGVLAFVAGRHRRKP